MAAAPEVFPTIEESRRLRELRALREELSWTPKIDQMTPKDYAFIEEPRMDTRPDEVDPERLDPSATSNAPFFRHLEFLHQLSEKVEAIYADEWPTALKEKDSLLQDIEAQFVALADRLGQIYFMQATALEAASAAAAAERAQGHTVFDTAPFTQDPVKDLSPLAATVCIVAVAALLLLGLSEDHCRFLTRSMVFMSTLTLKTTGLSREEAQTRTSDIPIDPRTAVKRLRLRSTVKYTPYVICPSCTACYHEQGPDSYPELCTTAPFNGSRPCGEALTHRRNLHGRIWTYPVRRILIQDMKAWLAWFLCRPNIVKSLIQEADPQAEMTDIFNAYEVTSFVGPDGQPFLKAQSGEIRLLFALNVDGFNPFQMKEAGRKYTSTAMYMTCLNLPPHLRYRVENMFLVGIIPGPKEPVKDNINHVLALLVDMLLEFWQLRVRFSRVPLREPGVLILLALFLVICDTPAARQVSGFGGAGHKWFCPYCKLALSDRGNLNMKTWPQRNYEHHMDCARRWKDARSSNEQGKIYDEAGVRYSALLELPYWNPARFTVIDIMHQLFEGNLKRFLRTWWGMSASRDDGDGTFSDAVRLTPHEAILDELWRHVRSSPFEELKEMRLDHLQALVERYNVPKPKLHGPSKNSKAPYLEALVQYRIHQGWFDENGVRLGTVTVDETPRTALEILELQAHPAELRSVEEFFQCAPDKEEFKTFNKRVLTAYLVQKENLAPHDSDRALLHGMTKTQLINRLSNLRYKHGIVDVKGDLLDDDDDANAQRFSEAQKTLPGSHRQKSSVLGKERLWQVWDDMLRIVMPGWLGRAPSHMGDGQHRKASADDWRVFVTVNLVVTMVRLWGGYGKDTRERQMLDNFMHLAVATKLACSRKMSRKVAKLYMEHMLAWLQGLRILFPGVDLVSNQHLSLHLPNFFLNLGPTHAWRCFVFELWNFLFQSINTNNHEWDLDITMFDRLLVQQRLRALVFDGGLGDDLQDLEPVFASLLEGDNRGTMLNDILASAPDDLAPTPPKPSRRFGASVFVSRILNQLADSVYRKFRVTLEPSLLRPIERKQVTVGSVTYSTEPPDCFVAIESGLPGNWRLAKIQRLFTHGFDLFGSNYLQRDYAVVQTYVALSEAEARHDHYREWPLIKGQLSHSEPEDEALVVPVEEILFHCCAIQWDQWDGIEGGVTLGLACDR
ncbi:unnamed protein product [Peniophora sp. CBMAI 1063]|nr:unnamed protein product [Peniophora sp. CBMAI 1063]